MPLRMFTSPPSPSPPPSPPASPTPPSPSHLGDNGYGIPADPCFYISVNSGTLRRGVAAILNDSTSDTDKGPGVGPNGEGPPAFTSEQQALAAQYAVRSARLREQYPGGYPDLVAMAVNVEMMEELGAVEPDSQDSGQRLASRRRRRGFRVAFHRDDEDEPVQRLDGGVVNGPVNGPVDGSVGAEAEDNPRNSPHLSLILSVGPSSHFSATPYSTRALASIFPCLTPEVSLFRPPVPTANPENPSSPASTRSPPRVATEYSVRSSQASGYGSPTVTWAGMDRMLTRDLRGLYGGGMNEQVDLTANHNGTIISIAVIFSSLSLLALLGRLMSKQWNGVRFTVDDVLLMVSWVIATGESSMIAAATQYARGGWHERAMSAEQMVAFAKTFYAVSILQPTTLALSKISILIFLHRIFITRKFNITVYVLSTIVVLWWIATTFGGAFICFPPSQLWNPTTSGTCGRQAFLSVITPIPWVITDFAILICPLPVIRNLQLSPERKLPIIAMISIGALTCLISVIRFGFVFFPMGDLSWDVVPLACANIVEGHMTIVCTSLIASKPVLAAIIPQRLALKLQEKLLGMGFGSWISSLSRSRRRPTVGSGSEHAVIGLGAPLRLESSGDVKLPEERGRTEPPM